MRWRHGRLEVSRTIDAPVDAIWDLLTETRYWPQWGPTVTKVEGPERIGAGSTGRIRTPFGLWLGFEITHYLANDHWEWTVSGRRATTHRVQAGPEGGTTVTFTAPAWAAPYGLILHRGLARLEALAVPE